VDAVLEGKVRRAGSRLRVTAQLTDVSNGLSLWSDSYERDAKDVFAVQDEIAKAIASALEVRFSDRQGGAPRDVQGTADPQAYDLYLRARYYWNKRGADNLRSAIGFFEAATARDPNFARAYAGAASSYVLLTEYSDTAPPDSHARAERAADRALALDPTVAEAYLARGLVDVHLWKWDEAGKAYRTAMQLDPGSATAHQWLGELFYTLGLADSCIAQMRQAKALDPLAPIPAVALGYALYAGRHYQDALRETLRARELAQSLELVERLLAQIYLQLGDSTRALEAARTAVRFGPEQSRALGILAYVTGSLGHREEALAALRQLQKKHRSPVTMLFAYVGLGEREKALAAAQDIITEHDPSLSNYPLLLDPSFDSLRNTDTFRRVMTEAGLLKAP
jgi:serine/threonine-protein kinase